MRPITSPILTILLSLLSFAAIAEPADQTTEGKTASILTNGDFESATQQADWPDNWGNAPVAGVTREVEEGDHFMRLVSRKPGETVMLHRQVPLGSGTKAVEVFARYRTAGVKPGKSSWFDARMIMNFLDDAGQKMSPGPKPLIFSTNAADWRETKVRSLVPEGATTLEIMPALFQVLAGTLDLAEIRVTALSDAEAEAMKAEIAAAKKREEDRKAILAKDLAQPPITKELKVEGNQVVTPDGKPIWLQGLSVDSMQWSQGENILWSIRVAIDEWNSNVIRLAVHDTFWFGRGKNQPAGGEKAYRQLVDDAVKLTAAKGAYLVLDLHQFGAPTEEHVAFWKDAAERYKNHPAVLYEVFNEPHGVSWEVWRNGGSLKSDKNKVTDVNPIENTLKMESDTTTGVQALVKAVRDTGAKNIVVAGALDWAYDLSGIVNGYALDDLGGNGIIYVSHIYPWKKDWQEKVLVAAEKHPVIITEIGCPDDYKSFSFIPEHQRYPLEGWSEDVLGMIQKHKLHWTGFSFHPHCGPQVISDWNYTPTPYWGVYVKRALAGEKFEMKRMR